MINGTLNLMQHDQLSCNFVHIGFITPHTLISTILNGILAEEIIRKAVVEMFILSFTCLCY